MGAMERATLYTLGGAVMQNVDIPFIDVNILHQR
jgi:hypothetical protein